jgi:hypothetical protein
LSIGSPAAMVEVRLIDLPVAVWARAQQHVEELLREFTLLIAGVEQAPKDSHVPGQLLQLVEELQEDFAGMTDEQDAQLTQAAAAGKVSVELTYRVPPTVAQACERLAAALDAADEFCRSGQHLLTLATPADALAYRRWYLGEFIRQISGLPPTPWPRWAPEAGRWAVNPARDRAGPSA